jgi:hypothetical protein
MQSLARELIPAHKGHLLLFQGLQKVANEIKGSLKSREPLNLTNLPADHYVALGFQMGVDFIHKIRSTYGDGGKSGLLLYVKLLEEGLSLIEGGADPIVLCEEIEQAALATTFILKESALPPLDYLPVILKKLQDPELERLFLDDFSQMEEAVVLVEEGGDSKITRGEALCFPHGYVNPYPKQLWGSLVGDVALFRPKILLLRSFDTIYQASHLLQTMAHSGQSLLILSSHFSEDVIATLLQNKLLGLVPLCAVQIAPTELESLGKIMGASLDRIGCFIEANVEMLCCADWAYVTREHTLIQLPHNAPQGDSLLYKPFIKLQPRIAPGELFFNKKRGVEEVIASCKALLRDGLALGSGLSWLRAAHVMHATSWAIPQKGRDVCLKGCEEPFRQCMIALAKDPESLKEQVLQGSPSEAISSLGKIENFLQSPLVLPSHVIQGILLDATAEARNFLSMTGILGLDPSSS